MYSLKVIQIYIIRFVVGLIQYRYIQILAIHAICMWATKVDAMICFKTWPNKHHVQKVNVGRFVRYTIIKTNGLFYLQVAKMVVDYFNCKDLKKMVQ